MRIVQISDLHGHTAFIDTIADEITAADLVVLSGDLTNFAGRHKTVEIIEAIRKYNGTIVAVPGNCDHRGVGEYLEEAHVSIDRSARSMNGYLFVGIGGSLPCPGKTPNEYTENEYEEIIATLEQGERCIYVIHQPPAETTTDKVSNGAHVGSVAIRKYLEDSPGLLCLTGHIHESAGTDMLGNVHVVNPGPARHGRYAIIDIDSDNVEIELKNSESD